MTVFRALFLQPLAAEVHEVAETPTTRVPRVLALVDVETGSCRDGLHPDRANENRGGESVVSYLLGLLEIRQAERLGQSWVKRAPGFS